MAIDPTTLADLILPAPVSAYVEAQMPDIAALISSGAASYELNSAAQMGGNVIQLRHFEADRVASEPDDGSDHDGADIASRVDAAPVMRRIRQRIINPAVFAALGPDANAVTDEIARQSGTYWAWDIEQAIVAIVLGALKTGGPLDSVVYKMDVGTSSGAPVPMSLNQMFDASGLMGDRLQDLSIIAVHSKQLVNLAKETASKLESRPVQDALGQVMRNDAGQPVMADYFFGKRIVLTDQFGSSGSGVWKKYTGFVCRPGAISLGWQLGMKTVPFYLGRSNQTGINQSVAFAGTIGGIKWTGTAANLESGPTNVELGTAANWTLSAVHPAEVGIRAFITNAT
jgi:hypothetical protein